MSKPRSGTPEVPRITSAPEPLADEVARRTRRYLIQMGIRVVCFLSAVLTWGLIPAWISWILIASAVVLPYFAVILANAGRERRDVAPPAMAPRALESGEDGGRG
ncbi:MAG: DUF3099 domain-containing protein [Cellulomonas sp.]